MNVHLLVLFSSVITSDALHTRAPAYNPECALLSLEVMMVGSNRENIDNGTPGRGTPTLVEVNTRWHLTDFAPLTDACVGYNAVDETLSAYLDQGRFDALPRVPPVGEGARYGRVVHLVSYVEGPLEEIRHEEVTSNTKQ